VVRWNRWEFGARSEYSDACGFDHDPVEDLKSYIVKLSKFANYGKILKNSVASMETARARYF
jgi:hypothetical protein